MTFSPPKLELTGCINRQPQSLGRILRDPLESWPESLLHTGIEFSQVRGRAIVFVSEPKVAAIILLNRDGCFPRARLHDLIIAAGYGETLIQGSRSDWRDQRRVIAKPISSARAVGLAHRIKLAIREMLDEWLDLGPDEPVPLVRDARRLTLDTLFRALFANERSIERRDGQVDAIARRIAADHSINLKDELTHLTSLTERLLKDHAKQERLSADAVFPKDPDTLTLFLHAGHDNASAALVWMLWLVSQRPDLQAVVRNEWRNAGESAAALDEMHMIQAIVRETLRLYPPVIQLVRDISGEIEICGRKVYPGSAAVISIYAMQRLQTLWDQPDAFMPERFMGDGEEHRRQRDALMPFGKGPRGCIGSNLAHVELCLSLAMICERFEISPNPDCPLVPHAAWTLRPLGEKPIFLRPRR